MFTPSIAVRIAEDRPGSGAGVSALLGALDEVSDAEQELAALVRAKLAVSWRDSAVLQYVERCTRLGRMVRARDVARVFGLSSGGATEMIDRLD